MEMDERKSEPMCPIVDIDGFIADGKQFDLDITLLSKSPFFSVLRSNSQFLFSFWRSRYE